MTVTVIRVPNSKLKYVLPQCKGLLAVLNVTDRIARLMATGEHIPLPLINYSIRDDGPAPLCSTYT
jgi:hypothetical protein